MIDWLYGVEYHFVTVQFYTIWTIFFFAPLTCAKIEQFPILSTLVISKKNLSQNSATLFLKRSPALWTESLLDHRFFVAALSISRPVKITFPK